MWSASATSSNATSSSRRRRLPDAIAGLLLAVIALPGAAADRAVVLEYHHVSTRTPPSTSVTPAVFESHMDHLAEGGFHVWPLPRLVRTLRAGGTVPERTVAITFDDSYASVYTEAFPRLRARGWPFTVFVAPGYIDRGYDGFTTWEQLREMEAAGVTIANHSLDHPHMVAPHGGEPEQWLARMRAQVTGAQQRLEAELDEPARLFAWPFGEFSPPLQEMLADAGFTGFGQQSGAIGPRSDFTALPRFPLATAYASLESFALKVRARPLPVGAVHPASGVLAADAHRPELQLTLGEGAYRPEGLRCYIGSGVADIARTADAPMRLTIRPPRPIGPGRTKVNCTAPASDGDGWFWYSHVWMMPNPDGSWYAD